MTWPDAGRPRLHAADPVRDRIRDHDGTGSDDAGHLIRLSEAKRMQAVEEMLDWPDVVRLRRRVTLVVAGTPALADAVATCEPVRRIELLPLEDDGPEGTFAKVCGLVFGDDAPGVLPRLHGLSDGLRPGDRFTSPTSGTFGRLTPGEA